jgi:26S proteasome regulatory subunit N7
VSGCGGGFFLLLFAHFPFFFSREITRLISSGRLTCKIDKVGGIIETNRIDSKNSQYADTVKHGDQLLNRVQKLSRFVHL